MVIIQKNNFSHNFTLNPPSPPPPTTLLHSTNSSTTQPFTKHYLIILLGLSPISLHSTKKIQKISFFKCLIHGQLQGTSLLLIYPFPSWFVNVLCDTPMWIYDLISCQHTVLHGSYIKSNITKPYDTFIGSLLHGSYIKSNITKPYDTFICSFSPPPRYYFSK